MDNPFIIQWANQHTGPEFTANALHPYDPRCFSKPDRHCAVSLAAAALDDLVAVGNKGACLARGERKRALAALRELDQRAGGPVIVDGATGGVGSITLSSLSRWGYQAVALTDSESRSDWRKKLGAKEILLRQSLNLQNIKPLHNATWAGAVDNLGGLI